MVGKEPELLPEAENPARSSQTGLGHLEVGWNLQHSGVAPVKRCRYRNTDC